MLDCLTCDALVTQAGGGLVGNHAYSLIGTAESGIPSVNPCRKERGRERVREREGEEVGEGEGEGEGG